MITIFGAPGAGKTIQGKLIAEKYGWRWFSYRDLLLSLHDKDIAYALEHGLFIDSDEIKPLIQKALSAARRSASQVILDGFPTDYRQLEWLKDIGELAHLNGAIVLRVSRGELWRRLVERKRVDDTRATIERRQDEYDRNITSMIKNLTMNGIEVREVNGENSPTDVLDRIKVVLADWKLVSKKEYIKILQK